MHKKSSWLGLLTVSLLLIVSAGSATAYDYPFSDPYVATVIGTPPEFAAKLPSEVPVKMAAIRMFPERKIPGILWNLDQLYYSYISQNGPAPLIFLIAGTGAGFNSPKMQAMQKAFYQAGYHVISISSPTHPNFIVAASTSGVPGHLEEDAADIYRVMRAIYAKHKDDLPATKFFLTGYSLGAAQSAFVAKLDEREKAFNFSRVLLINPPVSLYNSVVILDAMLADNIPGGIDHFKEFYDRVINAFADVYKNGDDVQFNNDFLYDAYKYRKPTSDEPLAALIGTSFRISSMNMVFASDVLTKASYVVPRNLIIARYDNVDEYRKVLGRLTFVDYFEGIFLPHFQALNPAVTEDSLIQDLSLRSIEDYLRTSPKFGLIDNEDDLILKPGEIDYLRNLFGNRATIYPHGGHCGNMDYPDNVATMVGFFQAARN
jgi:hypothetical protein